MNAALLAAQPCRLLFVHRDADNQLPQWRHDEDAIRAASGRVSGREPLGLPALARIEQVSNPKQILRDALVAAHGTTGRRAQRFSPAAALHRLANLIDDWSPLRQLSAFQRLEADTGAALAALDLPLRSLDT